MTVLDHQYLYLLKNILEKGYSASTRNGNTLSLPAFQISHSCMEHGFPILECKKVPFKTVVTELIWFLSGGTSIEFLLKRNCHIWTGDAMVRAARNLRRVDMTSEKGREMLRFIQDESIEFDVRKKEYSSWIQSLLDVKLKDSFERMDAYSLADLGPIYGQQWRNYTTNRHDEIDQINNLVECLKTDPDNRRMLVSAWNIGDLEYMALPPCHYGFQVYTRLLSLEERINWCNKNIPEEYLRKNTLSPEEIQDLNHPVWCNEILESYADSFDAPKRAISLIWNQRSTDVPLGLPFNIASYGMLLYLLAETVNMVPDMLYGNLTNVHVYENQKAACVSILENFEKVKDSPINTPEIDFRKIQHSKGSKWLKSLLNDTYNRLESDSYYGDKHDEEFNEIISLLAESLVNYRPEKKVSIPLSN